MIRLQAKLQIVSLSQSSYVLPVQLTDGLRGEGVGGGGGGGLRVAESFYHKKSWASINRSILSSRPHIPTVVRKLSDPYRLTRKKLAQVESTNIRSSC
jgi:hypothetical protein